MYSFIDALFLDCNKVKLKDDNNIFDINVQQYLSLPLSVKNHLKGIINTNVIILYLSYPSFWVFIEAKLIYL